jgi:hypothetical protein
MMIAQVYCQTEDRVIFGMARQISTDGDENSIWPNIYGKCQFSILIPTWKNKAVQVQEIASTKDPRIFY